MLMSLDQISMVNKPGTEMDTLYSTLTNSPEDLLAPSAELHESARQSVKYFIDPLAKRYSTIFKDGLYLNGMDSLQIWEQARLVLESVASSSIYDKIESMYQDNDRAMVGDSDDELEKIAKRRKLDRPESDTTDSEEDGQSNSEGELSSDSDMDEEDAEVDEGIDREDEPEVENEDENDDERVANGLLDDISDTDEMDEDEEGQLSGSDIENEDYDIVDREELDEEDYGDSSKEYVKDVHGLNDGFFNIDEFNRLTEETEQNSFGNDRDDDDDDEEIDFFADPDEAATFDDQRNHDDEDEDDYDEDDIENHDFGGNATVGGLNDNANDIMYGDFFAPPKGLRKKSMSTGKRPQRRGKFKGLNNDTNDEDLELALDNMKKDLFDLSDDEEDQKMVDDKGESLSTFEMMQRKIKAQISELEQQNVAKKDWQLMGETKAKDRPLNSLLEEDLEFDRNAKPVPVITQETTDSLEDVIRNRIKTNNFDDLPRRLPDNVPDFRQRRLDEVDQSKSTKSLAQIYEDEHLRAVDPENNPTLEDSKLKEAHDEIKELFSNIVYKLDALSSWHFAPKPAKPSITIVSNAPSISMEEARPVGLSTEAMLAPQEIYIPSSTDKSKEVIGKDGLPQARDEMSREERKRRRRREKAKHAKREAHRLENRKVRAQKEGSRANVIETLKKANVTIIGKSGEKRDVEGRLKRDKKHASSSGLKL
ncbi:U3 small nucleolar ribonucleoprotein complex, subunit Mpp10 [Dipodascopsis uninucleata]